MDHRPGRRPEQGAAAVQHALDGAAWIASAPVASRLSVLLDSIRLYRSAAVDEVRIRAKDLTAARPSTIAA
ncbi:hypothetical protein [Streptomyces sp. NPDC058964]|uniref:hypothetical protein n=1 Tax=Streptomyces sp. NPDC058964 TaxID=3346681 RepID=UPI0036AE2D89